MRLRGSRKEDCDFENIFLCMIRRGTARSNRSPPSITCTPRYPFRSPDCSCRLSPFKNSLPPSILHTIHPSQKLQIPQSLINHFFPTPNTESPTYKPLETRSLGTGSIPASEWTV